MADDNFTRDMFRWLAQVVADKRLRSAASIKVAFAIGQHVNRKTGEAWPSRAVLAAAVSLSVRSVQTGLNELVNAGHLTITSGRGRHKVNVYRVILKSLENGKQASPLDEQENRKHTSSFEPENGKQASSLRTHKIGSTAPEKVKHSVRKGEAQRQKMGSTLHTEPSEEPSEEPSIEPSEGKSLAKRSKSSSHSMPEICPTEMALEWASNYLLDQGRPDLAGQLSDIAARFRDHHLSKGSRFKDWDAAFRTWIRNELKFSKPDSRYATGSLSAVRGIMQASLREEDR